ncbi:MAG: hypothetical protein ABR886_11630 [Dehalococcoidales bacterium]|jgi:Na+/melibiose symporter-like transporter
MEIHKEPPVSLTPEQEQRNTKVFSKRKFIHYTMTALAIIVVIVFIKFRSGEKPVPVWGFIVFIAIMVAIGVASFFNWRCPSCHKYLGSYWNPRKCPRCGAKLQN